MFWIILILLLLFFPVVFVLAWEAAVCVLTVVGHILLWTWPVLASLLDDDWRWLWGYGIYAGIMILFFIGDLMEGKEE